MGLVKGIPLVEWGLDDQLCFAQAWFASFSMCNVYQWEPCKCALHADVNAGFVAERNRKIQERGHLSLCDREYSVSIACDTQCSLCSSQATVFRTCARGQNSLCVSCLLLNSDWQQSFFVCMNLCVCVTSLFLCVCVRIKLTDWQHKHQNVAWRGT